MLDRELEDDARGKDGPKIRLWVHAVELEALRTQGPTTAQLRCAVSQALHHPNLAAALNDTLTALTGWTPEDLASVPHHGWRRYALRP